MNKIKEHIINQFTQQVGYVPNINNPKSFNEKIQWLKLYYRDPLMTQCADKYAVREYIKEKIGEKYLIPLLGVYDNADEIDFDKLPNKFVLKINNGSGKNIICKNKKILNIKEVKNKLTEWLKPENSHYFYSYEWSYKNIDPKIICEEYIEQSDGKLLDYKFLCFNGKPKYIWVDIDRFSQHKRNFYDLRWNLLDIEYVYPKEINYSIPKPKQFENMVILAKKLSSGFPHVRIDLYEIKDHLFFGEMTFYPENGMGKFEPVEWDYKIGKLLDINKIKNKNILDYLDYKKTRKAKVAIYTAYNENYDKLINHTYLSKDFDYICYTDKKIKKPGVWEIKLINKTKLDAVRTSRYYKLFPHELLSKYKYSIWIDSNVDVTSDVLEKNVNELITKKIKIAIPPHFERNCIYQEAKACIDQQKDEPEVILKQVDFLKKEKYPQNNGLFETNIIFREHKNSKIIKLMNNWWWMIENFSRRDQLSFNYVLWKNKINCTPLFPQNARLMSDDFVFNDHNRKVVSTAFVLTKNKFNNNEFVQKIVSVPGNNYKVSFNLNDSKKITKIIFNPLKNQFCQFKINKIKIDNKILDLSKIKYESNGTLLDNSYIDFSKTSDPQIVLNINKKINKLKIVGNINFYNTENLYIDSTNQINNLSKQIEEVNKIVSSYQSENQNLTKQIKEANKVVSSYQSENQNLNKQIEEVNRNISDIQTNLNNITSSKYYKIWRFYCKFKDAIK